jgi:hypothetical protein
MVYGSTSSNIIEPTRAGKKFAIPPPFLKSAPNHILQNFFALCKAFRQVHLDVVAGALLYKLNAFSFQTLALTNTFYHDDSTIWHELAFARYTSRSALLQVNLACR